MTKQNKLLFEGTEWDFDTLDRTWKAIDNIGKNQLGLDYYKPQIEIISSQQMLENYSSHAMPIMYNHWSFGKTFIQNEASYQKGRSGLAYEVVINTNPSIAYCMENNSMTMQALVLSHASVGHSFFFKNNYLFKDWSDADFILDYLKFARNYIKSCEEKYGEKQVELLLDACHSLQYFGIDRYKKPIISKEFLRTKYENRKEYEVETFSDMWRTLPSRGNFFKTLENGRLKAKLDEGTDNDIVNKQAGDTEENILYFIEKYSPVLHPWQREVVRIVRKIAQYFYPQMQTQLMNEGCASFVHHTIMNMMFDQGLIGAGSILEFIQSHAGVVYQPDWNSPYYSGINVYALGYAMMQDIKRICEHPDEEDRRLFHNIAGTDWLDTFKYVVGNYRDESFVLQFLSPKIIKKFKLFNIKIDETKNFNEIVQIHDDIYLHEIRRDLAAQYDLSRRLPNIEVAYVNWKGDRTLFLDHIVTDDVLLAHDQTKKTLQYLEYLWGYDVQINPVIKGE